MVKSYGWKRGAKGKMIRDKNVGNRRDMLLSGKTQKVRRKNDD